MTLRVLKLQGEEVISMKKTFVVSLALGMALMAAVAMAWAPIRFWIWAVVTLSLRVEDLEGSPPRSPNLKGERR